MAHPLFVAAVAAGAYLGYRYLKKQLTRLEAQTAADTPHSNRGSERRPTLHRDPQTGVYSLDPRPTAEARERRSSGKE